MFGHRTEVDIFPKDNDWPFAWAPHSDLSRIRAEKRCLAIASPINLVKCLDTCLVSLIRIQVQDLLFAARACERVSSEFDWLLDLQINLNHHELLSSIDGQSTASGVNRTRLP